MENTSMLMVAKHPIHPKEKNNNSIKGSKKFESF
jgi:hypothetical protein